MANIFVLPGLFINQKNEMISLQKPVTAFRKKCGTVLYIIALGMLNIELRNNDIKF